MQELRLCAAALFGLLTLWGTIALIVSDVPRHDDALLIADATCAALFFYFLHAWRRGTAQRLDRIRTTR